MTYQRITAFVVMTSLFVFVKTANMMIPMKDFEPDRISGLWYGWTRTAGLFDKDSACTVAHYLHKSGDSYRTTFFYLPNNNKIQAHVMDITDNAAEKAKFVFENDVHTVAMTILDTDYENYLMFYALLGSKTEGVYYFGGRKPQMMENLREKLDAAIKKNEITFPFLTVRQTNCPNMTGGLN